MQISRNDFEHLLQMIFDCSTIAIMLGVSLRTVHRHMDEYCLTVHPCYTDIDDARVDHIVRELKKQFPGHHLPEDGTTPSLVPRL